MRTIWELAFLLLLLFTIASAQPDLAKLETGKSIERELNGGESHTYSLPLTAGQFVHVKTEQKGIDVVLRLQYAPGNSILQVDSPNGASGEESLSLELRLRNSSDSSYFVQKGIVAGRYFIVADPVLDCCKPLNHSR